MNVEKKQIYGELVDGKLIRKVEFKKHFLWKYKGYAFGKWFLKDLKFSRLQIDETDTGKTWVADSTDLYNHGIDFYTKKYGAQVVLPMEYFTEVTRT